MDQHNRFELSHPEINTQVKADARKYAAFAQNLRALSLSVDPKERELARRANVALIQGMRNPSHVDPDATEFQRSLGPAAVHVDTSLSNLSIQYRNEEYIGDYLLPMVPVDKLSNVFFKYTKRSRLASPDDQLAQRSQANEITDGRETDSYSCKSYGLKDYVDALTVENQDSALNEMMDATEALNDVLAFKRELRQAAILTSSANYGSNTAAVSALNRWDVTSGGTIISDIQAAVAALWSGAGPSKKVGFCSLDVWNAIARNAKILDLFKYTSSGLAYPKQVAGYFGLDDILVGAARKDTANEGQTASYSRIWSDVFGVVRVATRPGLRNASFGYTMRFKGRISTNQWFKQDAGAEGGYFTRVSYSDDYKVVAADTGYLLTTVIG